MSSKIETSTPGNGPRSGTHLLGRDPPFWVGTHLELGLSFWFVIFRAVDLANRGGRGLSEIRKRWWRGLRNLKPRRPGTVLELQDDTVVLSDFVVDLEIM